MTNGQIVKNACSPSVRTRAVCCRRFTNYISGERVHLEAHTHTQDIVISSVNTPDIASASLSLFLVFDVADDGRRTRIMRKREEEK